MSVQPAWFTTKLEERLALFEPAIRGGAAADFGVVMTTLTEADESATAEQREQWERTCDNCGEFRADGEPFFTGSITLMIHGVQVIVTFGTCEVCEKEFH